MHIVFLLSLNNTLGGGNYSIYKFAETFALLGHTVAVFYVGKSALELSSDTNLHLCRKYDYVLRGSSIVNPILEIIYDKLFLHPYLKKNAKKIDYIVGYQTHKGIKCVRLGKKYSIKSINFVFESPNWLMQQLPSWKKIYDRNSKLRKLWATYEDSLMNANIIVAISQLTADETENRIGRKCDLVMYPGIPNIDHTFYNKCKINQIVYVGRLEESKNVNEIIEALAQLKIKTTLVICGTGSKKSELESLALMKNVDVVFKGAISDAEKWSEIGKSLFMVFPSSFEGFGMPPMEALLLGIPCICTEIPIFREVYGNCVEYFREHDISDLCSKIQIYLENKHTLSAIGEIGRKYVTGKYGWDKSVNMLINVIGNENTCNNGQE